MNYHSFLLIDGRSTIQKDLINSDYSRFDDKVYT